jgi:hypothetical protein
MSSWQYAFLFPQTPNQLRPANAARNLTAFAQLDGSIRLCVSVDDEGHLLDVGEEVALSEPFERELTRYLEAGKSFSTQLRSNDIVLSVEFLLESPNPHISIGWPHRLFDELRPPIQVMLWNAIRSFAKDCDAAYVVIVDDAPDHFEDRFLDIDGKRVFDLHVTHRYGLKVREIWLQRSIMSVLPGGATYGESEQVGEGFERHLIVE